MDLNIEVFDKINSLTKEFNSITVQQEKNIFNNINNLLKDFMVVYGKEKQKLPYHINILDLLWANENAHSRIFSELLKQKNGLKFELLENFINYLKTLNSYFDFKIIKPKITSEKDRIDLLILDEDYALIIENKIHSAVDQEVQIARYITKVKDKGIKEKNIFIIYLTRDGDKKPSDQTWGSKEEDYKKRFKERFFELSFRENILPWMKNGVLPNCRVKDVFLKSTIEQYIDYLEGMFNKREIHKAMNEELKKHIISVLELDSNPEENISKLEKKLEEILKLENQLKPLIKEQQEACWTEWLKRLKKDFPNCEIVDGSKHKKLKKVGVILDYNNYKFSVLIEQNSIIYYGICNPDVSPELIEKNKIFTKPLIEEFKEEKHWYGWKSTSFKNGYERLKTLIIEVKEALAKTNNA